MSSSGKVQSPQEFSYQGDMSGLQKRRTEKVKRPNFERMATMRRAKEEEQEGVGSSQQFESSAGASGFDDGARVYTNAQQELRKRVHGDNPRMAKGLQGLGKLEIKDHNTQALEAYQKQLEKIDSSISYLEQLKGNIPHFLNQRGPLLESYHQALQKYEHYNAIYHSPDINVHLTLAGERRQRVSGQLSDLGSRWKRETGLEPGENLQDLSDLLQSNSERIKKGKSLKKVKRDVHESFKSELKKLSNLYDVQDALINGRDLNDCYIHERKYVDKYHSDLQKINGQLADLQTKLFGRSMFDNTASYQQMTEGFDKLIGTEQDKRDGIYLKMLGIQKKLNPEQVEDRPAVGDVSFFAGGPLGDDPHFDGTEANDTDVSQQFSNMGLYNS